MKSDVNRWGPDGKKRREEGEKNLRRKKDAFRSLYVNGISKIGEKKGKGFKTAVHRGKYCLPREGVRTRKGGKGLELETAVRSCAGEKGLPRRWRRAALV